MDTENNSETRPLLDVETGAEVQQLTSNNRKCLQKPSKSCCVIIGILALFCILLGVTIFAIYEGIVPGDILFPVIQPETDGIQQQNIHQEKYH